MTSDKVSLQGILFYGFHGVSPEERATAMGVYQALYSVGMLVGPLASGFLADGLGLASVFYTCAILSLVVGGMSLLRVLPKR